MRIARFLRRRLVLLVCVLVVLIGAGTWWFTRDQGTEITADFNQAIGLYPGSSVRVLGVQVGQVDAIHPQGPVVRVDMHVNSGFKIPANAHAVLVAPSLVSDRYIQLTPAYTGGPQMASGTFIPEQHTMTPVEIDDLYRSAITLSQALGPNGANKHGALSNLLNTSAANLNGHGQDLNTTMRQLSSLSSMLASDKGDLFTTVDNLNKFTATLAESDSQVRELDGRLANVTGFLADEHTQLGLSLNSLAGALTDVNGFIKDNRQNLSSNVKNLTTVTQALVNQRQAVSEVLDVAPLAATNFVNAYDAASGTVSVRGDFQELSYAPVLMVCKLIEHGAPKPIPAALTQTCNQLAPVLDGALKLPSVNQTIGDIEEGQLPPLPLPLLNAEKAAAAPPAEAGAPR
jgi:virulence factor Mce-like protein